MRKLDDATLIEFNRAGRFVFYKVQLPDKKTMVVWDTTAKTFHIGGKVGAGWTYESLLSVLPDEKEKPMISIEVYRHGKTGWRWIAEYQLPDGTYRVLEQRTGSTCRGLWEKDADGKYQRKLHIAHYAGSASEQGQYQRVRQSILHTLAALD